MSRKKYIVCLLALAGSASLFFHVPSVRRGPFPRFMPHSRSSTTSNMAPIATASSFAGLKFAEKVQFFPQGLKPLTESGGSYVGPEGPTP